MFFRTVIISVILVSTFFITQFFSTSQPIPISIPLKSFPIVIGGWKGNIDYFDNWVYEKTGVDDSLLANFYDKSGNYIQLYIGYYESQKEGDIIHSPRNCMPGEGWNIQKITTEELLVPSRGSKPIKVLLLYIQKGLETQLALYWYHSRGRVISSEYFQKYYLIVDSIIRKRTDGAFIRLISPIRDNEYQTINLMKFFAIELFPILDQHLPS